MTPWQNIPRRLWHLAVDHIDPPLFAITLAIMGVGLATVFSATYDSQNRLIAQFVNMSVALGLMWGVAQVPPWAIRWADQQVRSSAQALAVAAVPHWVVSFRNNRTSAALQSGRRHIQTSVSPMTVVMTSTPQVGISDSIRILTLNSIMAVA